MTKYTAKLVYLTCYNNNMTTTIASIIEKLQKAQEMLFKASKDESLAPKDRKVKEIKEQIKTGTYKMPSGKEVASKIVEKEIKKDEEKPKLTAAEIMGNAKALSDALKSGSITGSGDKFYDKKAKEIIEARPKDVKKAGVDPEFDEVDMGQIKTDLGIKKDEMNAIPGSPNDLSMAEHMLHHPNGQWELVKYDKKQAWKDTVAFLANHGGEKYSKPYQHVERRLKTSDAVDASQQKDRPEVKAAIRANIEQQVPKKSQLK